MATTIQPASGRAPKRGDLVILSTVSRTVFVGAESVTEWRHSLGRITSVSRDGEIRACEQPFFTGGDLAVVNVTRTAGEAHHAPAARYDVAAILEAHSRHTYDGSHMVKPYSDASEVRALVDSFKLD